MILVGPMIADPTPPLAKCMRDAGLAVAIYSVDENEPEATAATPALPAIPMAIALRGDTALASSKYRPFER
jgi:glycerophosphoryl diester phosphodiesterase